MAQNKFMIHSYWKSYIVPKEYSGGNIVMAEVYLFHELKRRYYELFTWTLYIKQESNFIFDPGISSMPIYVIVAVNVKPPEMYTFIPAFL